MRERWGSWVRLGKPSEYYASKTSCEEREGECSTEAWQTVMQLKEGYTKWSARWAQAHPWRKTVSPRDGSVLICLSHPVCGWWQSTWVMASYKPCWEFQSSVARTLVIYTPQAGTSAECILVAMTNCIGSSRRWVPRCPSDLCPRGMDSWQKQRITCIQQGRVPHQGYLWKMRRTPVMSTQCPFHLSLNRPWCWWPCSGVRLHSTSAAAQGSLQIQFHMRHPNHHCICHDVKTTEESSTIINVKSESASHSVVSDSLWPHRL